MSDICRGKLTDYEYLKHMIPHHQVAVDISIMHQKKSKLPVMQQILRELVWTQRREINLMKRMLNELPQNISCENTVIIPRTVFSSFNCWSLLTPSFPIFTFSIPQICI